MATKRKTIKAPASDTVQVSVAKRGTKGPKPDIEVRTGLTEGKKYFVTVTPKTGRPVLIAVHL